jgi:gliding motility-associated-like protein
MRSLTSYRILLVLCLILSAGISKAQLTLDYTLTPDEIAQNLVGDGVEIFNAQLTAADSSYAYYTSNNTEIGTSEGVLLTTGRAWNAVGPNDETGLPDLDGSDCLNCNLYDNFFPGSPTLTTANGGLTTWDACKLQFDIVPQGDSLKFDFVFASEEYLEWVGSPFNDVFGFFITGPGIGSQVNIALIPGTSQPVAINNVNNIDNTTYFFDNQNPLGQGVQYDGFTVDLQAKVGNVIPCETYTLELIIADGSDRLYDSAVFVSKIESNPIAVLTSTAGGTDYMIEGCNDGTVTFESGVVQAAGLDVNFTLSGDAELGVDYTTSPDLTPFYDALNDFYTITIPPGETNFSFEINTVDDGLGEGTEFISVQLVDQLCDGLEFQSSVDFEIEEELFISLTPASATVCTGNCVSLLGEAESEGDADFSWSPIDGLSDPNSLTPEACPTTTTTYTLTSTLASCTVSASSTITVANPSIAFDVDGVTCQEGNNGAIDITITDATAPFTFEWTLDGDFFSSDEDLTDVPTGEYCVTITDALGCTSTECIDVVEVNLLNISDVNFSDYTCFPISCNGACDGSIELNLVGGIAPYTTTVNGVSVIGDNPIFEDLCAGVYDVTVVDDIGCEITASYTLEEPEVLEIQVDGTTDVLCTGEETGVITVTTTGGCPFYTYSWSHDPNLTSPLATSLPAGDFTVTVTDVNGCSSAQSVTITINEPAAPLAVSVDNVSSYPGGFGVSCPDAEDGSIDISITGGTPPYLATWIHDQSGTTYVGLEDLSGLPCGTYEYTVNDDNGCSVSGEVEISCVPDWDIQVSTIPNPCGDPNAGLGEIEVIAGGAHGGPFILDWTSGSSCPCTGPNLTGLNSGNYELTVTDVQGCTTDLTINVGENDQFNVSEVITDASCGGTCDGSIDVTVAGTPADSFAWTGPDGFTSSDQNIENLCAGSYILTVVSGSCEEQFVYIVGEPTPIDIDFDVVVPPICFGQNNGSIELGLSGGNGVLTAVWEAQPECFFPETTGTSISNLFECTYVVEVTDEDGCSVSDSLFLDAPQVMDIFVSISDFGGDFNVSCNGANDGAISVSIEGGTPDCTTFAPECYDYDWTSCDPVNIPGVSQQNDLPAGSYCVVVTDINGCVATTEIDLEEPEPIESSGAVSDYNGFEISCTGACDGWISPNITGGNGNYVLYQWITGDIGDNEATADTLFNLCPGSYELRVVDQQDCENIILFELEEPEELDLTVDSITPVSCYDESDGAIAVTATGGTGSYTFDWNEGEYAGNVLAGIPGGVYDLVLTDSNDCTLEESVIVFEPDTFVVNLTIPILNDSEFVIPCVGDSTGAIFAEIQGGVPEYDILWTGAGIENPTELNQSELSAGTYTITVTDEDGCEAIAQGEITEPDDALEVNAVVSLYPSGEEISCFGACDGSIDLSVTGGVGPYTFLWELDNQGDTLSTAEDQIELCQGFYEVLVSDANGCDTLLQFDIQQPTQIMSNAVLSDFNGFNTSCPEVCDGSITIAPSGGVPDYTIAWTVNGNPVGGGETLIGLCAGDIVNLEITDDVDCVVEEVFVINGPDPINPNAEVNNISCDGNTLGSIILNTTGGTGDYTYTWTPDFGNVSSISDLTAGEYCVNIEDSNGCMIDECFTIAEPTTIEADIDSTPASCGLCDGTIALDISAIDAPFTVVWTGPTIIDDDATNASDLCEGLYTASITDANGCELILEETLEGTQALTASADLNQPLCYGDCNGSIDLSISNANGDASIVWANEAGEEVSTEEDLDGICEGTFSVTIIDELGCEITESYSIIEPDSISIFGSSPLYSNGFNVSSFEGNNGSIETNIIGGTPEYDIFWTGPTLIEDGEEQPGGLTAGSYVISITDANGCMKDSTIVLTEPDDLALPTGLSPNNDGANDAYVILGISEYPNNTFVVFNRWGNIVYEKNNYNNEWTGTNTDGEELPDGTYFVVFTAGDREFATYVDLRR